MISKKIVFTFFLTFSLSGYASPVFQTRLSESSGESLYQFGSTVSISEDYILAGAPGQQNSKGKACIFKRVGKDWNLQLCLSAITSEDSTITQFGKSVSLTENYAIVGASRQAAGKTSAAYELEPPDGSWTKTTES